jgi:hypothetical protein
MKGLIMKSVQILLATFLFSFAGSVAVADRPLEKAEILQIFQKLTNQPKKTWLTAGVIKATHEEYKAAKITDANEIRSRIKEKITEYQNSSNKRELTESLQKMELDAMPFNVRYELSNEYTMNSSVVVKFDGERFYWEIEVNSRTDSIKPAQDIEGNFMSKKFNLDWNAKRIFAWDGEKYTTYFLPGNHAIIDTTSNTPHVVNGPLTAGVIPWGYGSYKYETLAAADFSAMEKDVDGHKQVEIVLNNSNGSQMLFVLDAEKDYSVLSCSKKGLGNVIVSSRYSNYQFISGNWVPTLILLENYESGTNRSVARDLWNITEIDANAPQSYDFEVVYRDGAMIEYFSPLKNEPQAYRYSCITNTDTLLADRLAFLSENQQPKNCAAAAIKYSVSKLGKNVTDQQLSQLVNQPNGDTSLYQMKQFVSGLGLQCRAVKTDIQTLKNLNGCEVILHILGKKHFVVLERIDNEYVWTIDLASNKFYYRTDISFFGMDWSEGVALLISNQPIQLEEKMVEIDDGQLNGIVGAAGYSCTKLLQEYDVIFCTYIGGLCGGLYEEFYTRYGCQTAASGSCAGSLMVRYQTSPCINDPYEPWGCTVTGEWTCYYMRACA